MTVPAKSGIYNSETQTIYPVSTSTWSGLSSTTWDSWKEWNHTPASQIVWYTPIQDLGPTSINFTLNIETVANAQVSYQVLTSTTGAFAGEETVTVIASGATGVTSFSGRFFFVVVIADKIATTPYINSISVTYSTTGSRVLNYSQVDSSTLSGTSSSRTLPLGTVVSRVTDVKIMAYQAASAYNVDAYVTNTPTSKFLIPNVISRSTNSIAFSLVGVDAQPRDGVCDITVQALPEQYMSGNNLITR
jgi:hypothetical protein